MAVIETLYAGRDNTFSLQLVRGEQSVNLMSISGYSLILSNGRVFDDQDRFTEKEDGIVEISIGDLLLAADVGTHTAYLVTFDLVNVHGVRWPNFKLKVLR